MAHPIWRKVVLAVGVTLAVLVVVVLMVLPTPWFKEQVRRLAVRQAAAHLHGDLAVSSLSGSLFRDVTLHGVSIRLDGSPVVAVESIRAQYDLVALVRGRMVIDELVLTRPKVRAIETADGWNLRRLVRTGERTGGPSAPFTIRRVRVTDGEVTVVPRIGSSRTFNAMSVDAALELRGAAGSSEVRALAMTDEVTGLAGELRGDVRWDEDRVALKDGHVRTPASEIDLRVSYAFAPATVDAALDIERLAVSDLARYADVGLQRSVVLSGTLAAAGPLDHFAARWDISAGAATIRGDVRLGVGAAQVPVAGTVVLSSVDLEALTGRRDLRSDVTATVRVDGFLETADLVHSAGEFDIETRRIKAFDYEADRVDVSGRYAAGLLRLKGDISAYGAAATMSLVASRLPTASARSVRVSGRVRRLDLQRLPASLGAPDQATEISADYTAVMEGHRRRATVRFDDSRVGATVVAADSTASIDLVGKRLETFFDLNMENVSSALVNRPGEWGASGHVHGRVLLRDRTQPVSASSAEFSVCAELDDLRVRTAAAGRASVEMSLLDGLLTVRRLEVHDGVAALNATGVIAVTDQATSSSDLVIEAGVDDLSRLSDLGLDNLTGVVGVTARVTGPADALVATGTLRSYGVGWNDAVSALTFGGDFDLQVPNRDPLAMVATMNAEGTFVRVREQDIQRLTLTTRYERRQIDLTGRIDQVGRSLDLDGTLVLMPESREVRLRSLAVAGLGEPWRLASPAAVIRYGPADVEVEGVALARGEERIDASGRIALSADAPASDFRLGLANVNVSDLSTLVTGEARVAGRVNGDMRMAGSVPDPELVGTLMLTDGRVGNVPVGRAVVDIDLNDGRADVNAAVEPVTGAPLSVTGSVPAARDRGPLDLAISSPGIALGLVEGFTGQVANVSGTMITDLRVVGTIEEPRLDGTLRIEGGGFHLVSTGVSYEGLQASVRFDGRRATVDGLSLADSEGHLLRVSGGADAFVSGAARSFDAAIAADDFQVLANDLGDVAVRLDATIVGDVETPRIEGHIAVTRGRLEVDEILATLTAAPSVPPGAPEIPVQPAEAVSETPTVEAAEPRPTVSPVPPEPVPSSSGLFSRAAIDVDITMPDNVVLRGRDVRIRSSPIGLGNVNMTIGGTVEIRKVADAPPVVVGTTGVVRGVYDFQGRRFNVARESTVTFRGAMLNPSLDITGEREVSGVLVEVRVTGTARQPEITLGSRPPLDEADVLSLIVFNQPVNQLGDAEQIDLIERAGTLAAGTLATSLATSLGRALDMDLFEIRAPAGGEAGEVTVGRQMNERLFVGFRQLFGDADASRLSFEYRISDALRLVTAFAQGSDQAKRSGHSETAGADLVYVFRY